MTGSKDVEKSCHPAMFNVVVGGAGFEQRTEGEARELTGPLDKNEKEIAERSLGTDVFYEPKDM